MAVRQVNWTANIGGTYYPILSGEVKTGYRDAAASFSMTLPLTTSTLLSSITPNQAVTIWAGYGSSGSALMTDGYVDQVTYARPTGTITVTGRDKLKLVIETLYTPAYAGGFGFQIPLNTPVEIATGSLIENAGISPGDYSPDSSGSTLLITANFPIISAMDAVVEISQFSQWKLWARPDGVVRYGNIQPFPGSALSVIANITYPQIMASSHSMSDDWLRNRIIVFGSGSFMGVAQGYSPYVPVLASGSFYKTGVFSIPNVGISQEIVDTMATYTLGIYNRLTQRATVTIEGNPALWIGYGVTISEPLTIMSGQWSIYGVRHHINVNTGYLTDLELVQ